MRMFSKENRSVTGIVCIMSVWFISAMFMIEYQRHEMVAEFGADFANTVTLVFSFFWMLAVGIAMLTKD